MRRAKWKNNQKYILYTVHTFLFTEENDIFFLFVKTGLVGYNLRVVQSNSIFLFSLKLLIHAILCRS